MRNREPMTEAEARENLREMRAAGTNARAERRLIEVALGPLGNLSCGARKVYAERLSECAG